MTSNTLPLASRPRRAVVKRPPTLAQAERQLRRSAPRTTTTAWSRSAMTGRILAQQGVPTAEFLCSLLLVALGFVPVLVWSQLAPWAVIATVVSLAVATAVMRARRVVVGTNFVAVRSLLRYRVAQVNHLRHLQLRPTQRGGQLCLHTDDGTCVRLRRVEVDAPAVRAALVDLASCGQHSRDSLTCQLLSLEPDERTCDSYLVGGQH